MNSLTTFFKYAVSILVLSFISASALFAQDATANLQITHNSPDPAVESVDIFVNGDEFLTGVDFRAATAFDAVPAGVDLDIEIAPAGAGIENAVGPFTFNLDEDENYILVASGVVDTDAFPDAAGFSLEAFTPAWLESDDSETVAVNIMHGSPDAPAVDIYLEQTGDTPPVAGLEFPDFTGYVNLAADDEVVGIAGAGGDVLVEFSAPFATLELEGAALTVLASGFFNEANVSGDNAFGLLAVLPDGTALLLEAVVEPAVANLQIIHNSPDPAVASVDIFVNGDEFLTGVDFRAATAFDAVPAGVDLEIEIAPAGAGIANAVGPFTFNLVEDENYILVASGVVDTDAFPDAAGFSLEAFTPAWLESDDSETVAVNIMHGSPDAPAVDIYLEQTGDTPPVTGLEFPDFTGLEFPDFTGYVNLAPDNEIVGIAGAGGEILVEFAAPFADLELGGAALTVLASGFFNPENASEGNTFGLLAVLPDGTTLMLDVFEAEFANVQIIHNSADPAAASVDIFVNGDLALPGVEFRQATAFLELPGNTPLNIVVSPEDAGIDAGIEFEGVEFSANGNYYVVATGVLDPSAFAENPDEVDTGFFLDVIPNATMSADEGNFDFLIYHGSTDAPAVDIEARDVATLAAGVSYTGFTPEYISVPVGEYIIDILPAGSDDVLVSFDADVSALDGATGIVLASGFLDPAANNDGPGFGLILVLADGTVVELGIATSSEIVGSDIPDRFELNQNYPNPFNPTTNISYSLPQASDVRVEVYNVTGQRIAVLVDGQQSAGQYTINFDASNLASGVYLYRIQADNFTQTRRMTLIK